MRRLWFLAWLLLTVPALLLPWRQALAQPVVPFFSAPAASAPPSYTGPGDVVSGATAWYGLRAYNAAYISGGAAKAINVRRASDNTTQDINVLTTGALDTASALTFAGTDATATCSTSGLTTTMACTGASGTPHVNDTVTCSACAGGLYLTAVGSFVAGAGSVTLSVAQNIAVAGSTTFTWGLFVTEWYDEGGNGNNVTEATAGLQPQLLLTGGASGLPAILFVPGASHYLLGSMSSTNLQSYSLLVNDQSSGPGSWIGSFNSGQSVYQGDSTNSSRLFAGNVFLFTASSSVWHAIQAIIGASSVANVDGSETTGNAGTGGAGTAIGVGANTDTSSPASGLVSELGAWPILFNPTQRTNLCHNQRLYYGTPGSC